MSEIVMDETKSNQSSISGLISPDVLSAALIPYEEDMGVNDELPPEPRYYDSNLPLQGLQYSHESERLEYTEQFYAQVAAQAVSVPHETIDEGIRLSMLRFRKERKTKADWNSERVRDFSVMKKDDKPNKACKKEGHG